MEGHMRFHGDGLYPATSFPRTQVHHVAKRNHPLQGWLGRPDINNKRYCLFSGQRDILRHKQLQSGNSSPRSHRRRPHSSFTRRKIPLHLSAYHLDGRGLTRLLSHSYPMKSYGLFIGTLGNVCRFSMGSTMHIDQSRQKRSPGQHRITFPKWGRFSPIHTKFQHRCFSASRSSLTWPFQLPLAECIQLLSFICPRPTRWDLRHT